MRSGHSKKKITNERKKGRKKERKKERKVTTNKYEKFTRVTKMQGCQSVL
jgi:hypothetical protein